MRQRKKRRRLMSLLCICMMLAGMLNPASMGTALDVKAAEPGAIEISTPEELQKIGNDAAFPLTGDYVLTDDLDMSGIAFTPIGGTHGAKGAVTGSNVFSGTFDGQGHLISNLTIRVSEEITDYAQIGLFSVIASANASDYAKVSNLIFANPSLTVEIGGGFTAAGTLAGEVNGYAQIENVAVLDGSVIVNADNRSDTVGASGVIGECRTSAQMGNNNIIIRNIYNGAEILAGSSTDNNFAAGIIGRVTLTPCREITGCVNTGRTSFKGDLGMGIAHFSAGADSGCLTNAYFLFDTGRAQASTELEKDVMQSGVLPQGLSEEQWYASEGTYPLPVMCKGGGAAEYLGLLSLALDFSKGDSAVSVTTDFELPLTAGDAAVTWQSSNPDVVCIEGSTAKVGGVMSPTRVTLTASTADGKVRTFNITVVSNATAQFEQDYAKAGTPLTVVVANAPEDLQCTYTWSVGGQVVRNLSGNSYTPSESDKEKLIEVAVKAINYNGAEWKISKYMSDFPVVYIDTEDGQDVVNKTYKNSILRLQGNDEFTKSSVLYNGAAEIKGRGNSTWDYGLANGLKKPFKIKLDKKTDVLGMGKNKHWVLLANVIDHTNMRNKLMYDFSSDIGMQCVMDSKPVVLVMNGEYVGFYQLCEHKRVGDTRIDVYDWEGLGEDIAAAIVKGTGLSKDDKSTLEDLMTVDFSWYDTRTVTFKGVTYNISDYYKEEIPEFTGGFVMDMDFRIDDSKNISKFRTDYGYPMIFEAPEYAKTSPSMMNYVQTYIQAFEDAIHDDDFYITYDGEEVHYSDLYDIDSLLQNWFLVEYSMNWDGMKNSTLMYKDLNGKLTMGPAWDFDWAWGNINMYSMTGSYVIEGWHTTQDSFCEQAYQRENWNRYLVSDPYFVTLAYEKWQEIRGTVIEDMIKDGGKIDTLTEEYRTASEANDAKWASTYWKYSGIGITDGRQVHKQSEVYADAVNSMKYFIKNRVAWMDKQFTSVDNLLSSMGRYKGSNALQVTDIQSVNGGKNQITASISNNNARKIAFYVNGIRAGEADVNSGRAEIVVDDSMLRAGESKTNTVQIRALDASGNFLKSGANVLTNYKNFTKTVEVVPDVLTGIVTVEGNAVSGEKLQAVVTESNNTGDLSYQWYADGEVIKDAADESYVLTDKEIGKKVKVRITSSKESGYIESPETKAVAEPQYEAADKTALRKAIENAVPETEKEKYTAESWALYAEALAKAKEVEADEKASQAAVDAAVSDLGVAADALEETTELPVRPFEDVDREEGDWYYESVYYNFDRQIMNGVDEAHFEPMSTLARAQFAVILHNIEKKPEVAYEAKFKDVADGQWYTNAILWASSKEIVTGYTDGSETFGWGDKILREQMAVMMYRYAKNFKKYDVSGSADYSGFADAEKVSEYAKEAVSWAVGAEIITGKDLDQDGTPESIDPQGDASRAECAIIIQRFLEKYEK